ncbi:YqjF family protein [Nocardiopsis trehalosi]|uniref:YqjF family protein n=1 Tax=Nocardiopsis trehalosi TaxID=109329 RepID=UPI000B16C4EC|nr:DUF2071 domain-containing protein [Nocardiopsis trehalosi]
MAPAPSGSTRPPPLVAPPMPGPPLVRQSWRDAVFLHWRIAPERVAPLLPAGTRPDVLDGAAHVGVVAFRVAATTVLGVVPTGGFGEVNVRVYAVDGHGRRGTVFLSLDADSAHNALGGRAAAGIPYLWADVSLRHAADGTLAGAVRRRWPSGPARARWRTTVGAPIAAPSREDRFLTDRWGLHVRRLGRTVWIRVAHQPWRLHRCTDTRFEGDLLAAAGLPVGDRPPDSVLWSSGVDTGITPSLVPA